MLKRSVTRSHHDQNDGNQEEICRANSIALICYRSNSQLLMRLLSFIIIFQLTPRNKAKVLLVMGKLRPKNGLGMDKNLGNSKLLIACYVGVICFLVLMLSKCYFYYY